MKRLRWSTLAADDLERIRQHIEKNNPKTAQHTVKILYDGVRALRSFPYRGRKGIDEGTRELVFAPLPYLVVYRITPTHIEISRIWHGAQRRSQN